MEIFLGARQALYHVGATSVRSLKNGTPPLSICLVVNLDNYGNTGKEVIKDNKKIIIQVRSLQQGAPQGLDDVLLKVSSWGDPSQV